MMDEGYTQPSFKWGQSQKLLEGAKAAGFDPDAILSAVGIDLEYQSPADSDILTEEWVNLIRHLMRLLDDEMLGFGHKPRPLSATWLRGLLCIQADTLGEAIKRNIEFDNLLDNSFKLNLLDSGDQVELQLSRIEGQPLVDNFAVDIEISTRHRFLGWLINERLSLTMARLDYSSNQSYYHEMFYGAPVLFDADCSGLRFDSRYLNRPVVQNETSLGTYLIQHPAEMTHHMSAGGALSVAVYNKILEYLSVNNMPPGIDYIADQLGFKSQTLRRRLREEGSCYFDLKTRVRRDNATHLLGHSDLSVEEIGARAGYSTSGAFIRAFKAWTGMTPFQFRNSLAK